MKGDKSLASAVEFLEKLKEHLESGKPARSYDMTEDELEILKETPLLSLKPVIYAANLCEDDFRNNIESNEHYKRKFARSQKPKARLCSRYARR